MVDSQENFDWNKIEELCTMKKKYFMSFIDFSKYCRQKNNLPFIFDEKAFFYVSPIFVF